MFFPSGNVPEEVYEKLGKVAQDIQGCGRPIVIQKQNCCGEHKSVYYKCNRSGGCEKCKGQLSRNLEEACEKLAVYACEKKERLALMTLTLKERGAEGLEKWSGAMTKWLESRVILKDHFSMEGLREDQRGVQEWMLKGLRK